MNKKIILSLAVFFMAMWGSTVQAFQPNDEIGRGYMKVDLRTITQTFFSFYNGGNPSNKMLDEYAELAYCDLYKSSYVNDFEWASIRESIKRDLKAYSPNAPKRYEIPSDFKIGRYDFAKKKFPLHEDSVFMSVGSLSLFDPRNTFSFCGRGGTMKALPNRYILSLYSPLNLEEIRIDDEVARKIVSNIYSDSYGQRYFFAKFRVTLLDYLGNQGANIANNAVTVKGQLDSIELYLDPERTKKFHTITFDE